MTEYMKLYLRIRKDITDGVYPFGTKIPSKRSLADRSGRSLMTVSHAYDMLAEEGYIEPRERSGYFVTYRVGEAWEAPAEEKREFPASLKKTVPLEEESFPFSSFARTMRAVLAEEGRKILRPSPPQGEPALREAIASYLARSRQIRVSPEQIWIGSGAEYLYGLNIQALGRNRLYALESPSYRKIALAYHALGARTEMLQLGADGIESAELARSKASVLHVTPVGSFPSGVTASASKRREYLDWACRRQGLLIEDDFDSEFTVLSKPEDTLYSLGKEGTVIYMNTFSKTIAPSIRTGYLVLPRTLLPLYRKKVGFYACSVPVFDQLVLASFINSGGFERHINKVRRLRRKALRGK